MKKESLAFLCASLFFVLSCQRDDRPCALCRNDDYLQMKYQLLKTKASDIQERDLSADSAMTRVASYFEHHGSVEERLEAFYYMGSVYRDRHNSPQAIVWYKRAADCGEENIERIDTNMLSKVYSQLGYLLHLQYNELATLECCKRNYELREGVQPSFYPPLELARCYKTLFAYSPDSVHYKDSAYVYYSSLLGEDFKESLRDNLGTTGELLQFFTENGYREEADLCMKYLEKGVHSLPENVWQAKSTYFNTYSPADSFLYYCKMVYDETPSLRTRNAASIRLMNFYQKRGETAKALEYANVFVETTDSIERMTMLRQTSNAYNEYVYNRNVQEEARVREQARRTIWISVMACTLLLCMFLTWYSLNKRKILRIQYERNEALRENLELAEEVEDGLRRQKETALLKSKVYDQMRNYAENYMLPEDESMWKELYDVVDACYPDYRRGIREHVQGAHVDDIRLLYLLRLGMKQSEVSRMFNLKSRTVINSRLKRLEDKMGCKWTDL